MKHPMRYWRPALLTAIVLTSTAPALASPAKITELSLEQLLETEVTSVSKRAEPLATAASAIYVITQEDIRRSGATTIPDVLRMAPGLQVAQIDANKWAVSSRGFNAFSSNKLLVLMDGRTMYNPLFSGTLWDMQDTLLEDIDRIEIIRGPGATLWGANAVNGVINIISKHSTETQGTMLTATTGNEEKGVGTLRYGGKVNDHTSYRVYGKGLYRDDLEMSDGSDANDRWYQWHGGFRADSAAPGSPYAFTIQGDGYSGYSNATTGISTINPPYSEDIANRSNVRGANLLTRLTRKGQEDSEMMFQAYYDLQKSNDQLLGDKRGTADLEFQHRFHATTRQEITWGLGYRYSHDDLGNTETVSFDPTSRTDQLFSAFVQDEITLINDLLRFTVGSKFEHNDYTGYEVQPSGRLLYTPHKHHSLWAAVSRAVRTPSRADAQVSVRGAIVPSLMVGLGAPGDLAEITNSGNEEFKSEKLTAYEIGYRSQVHEKLTLDFAAFLNHYSRLRTIPATPTVTVTADPVMPYHIDYTVGNTMSGNTYGFEVVADAKPLEWWRVQVTYTFLRMALQESEPGVVSGENAEGESPRNQLSLRSMMDLTPTVTLDIWFRYVDSLPAYGIDSYLTLDARIGWQATPGLELALVGRNLLDNAQPEFRSDYINTIPSEIERSVYGKATWSF